MAEATTSLSFRVGKAKADQLERLAGAMDRPKSWLLQQALDAYLDVRAWQIGHIEQGAREIREGNGIPHEDVARWVAGDDEQTNPPVRACSGRPLEVTLDRSDGTIDPGRTSLAVVGELPGRHAFNSSRATLAMPSASSP